MQIFLGVEVDTATMTTLELEKARDTIQEMLTNDQHQIVVGYLVQHKHSSNNSTFEELLDDRNAIQEMLANIKHQIFARKMAEHRHTAK